jgi:hypothetical protein
VGDGVSVYVDVGIGADVFVLVGKGFGIGFEVNILQDENSRTNNRLSRVNRFIFALVSMFLLLSAMERNW